MTHTPEQLLAEKCTKFLGLEERHCGSSGKRFWKVFGRTVFHYSFFEFQPEREVMAPILMHLGKREMEELGFDGSYMFTSCKRHQWFFSKRKRRTTKRQAIKDHNDFISFWSAVEATGVMEQIPDKEPKDAD